METMDILEEKIKTAESFIKINDIGKGLDIIYDYMDERLISGEFDLINTYLSSLDIKNATLHLLLAILTITLPAKHELPYRKEFYKLCEQEIIRRNEMKKNLLIGLE